MIIIDNVDGDDNYYVDLNQSIIQSINQSIRNHHLELGSIQH
jgi:hypothetical protein